MSLQSTALAMGRKQAVGRFTESFTVFRATRVLNPTTDKYDDTEVVVHSGVSGRLKFNDTEATEKPQGGQVPVVQGVSIHVAVDAAPDAAVNDMWRCTASTSDSSLVGRVWRTRGLPQAGQVTAHRFPVESVA